MAITVGSNIASLKAQRTLGISSDRLARTYEKLSSGQRINRASDDAAGLAIADALSANSRIAAVAVRNANDGISTIGIADSALGEIGNVLARLAELSQQSANGVFSNNQRAALQNEFTALGSEIERIATTTEFNGVKLLSGGSELVLQVGFNSGSTSRVSYVDWLRLDYHSCLTQSVARHCLRDNLHPVLRWMRLMQLSPLSPLPEVYWVLLSRVYRSLSTTYRLLARTSSQQKAASETSMSPPRLQS
jgi:hypothetical protein